MFTYTYIIHILGREIPTYKWSVWVYNQALRAILRENTSGQPSGHPHLFNFYHPYKRPLAVQKKENNKLHRNKSKARPPGPWILRGGPSFSPNGN